MSKLAPPVSSYTIRLRASWNPGRARESRMAFYPITIFLSAFLLFQIQPIIAKMILPWFGGASSVWSTCMLFFQVVLLLGYLYAHWLNEHLSPRRQALVHGSILLLSLLVLPVAPEASWKGGAVDYPAWRILGLLAATVGLPYLLLSTTSPLLQAWYARTRAGGAPYRLFALSNLASLLGLLAYPFVVEPNLTVRLQGQAWSAAYAVFAILCGLTAWRATRRAAPAARPAGGADAFIEEPPRWRVRWLWLGLTACASLLLLAITAYLTQDVAAVPFLWIVPLSVYLLSFIICFEAPRLYFRPLFLGALPVALGGLAYALSGEWEGFKVPSMVLLWAGGLFVFAMVCHGELVRRKPSPRYLTTFYVMVALGGALGGLFVGLAAPSLFPAYYELPIGLALAAAMAVVVLWPRRAKWVRAALACGFCGYVGVLVWVTRWDFQNCRISVRNFYSQLRVREVDDDDGAGPRRKLLHGVINHGEQVLAEAYRHKPSTYFCPESGVGRVMQAGAADPPRRIGILGLGAGTLVAYGRRGDVFRIYEINPQVARLARSEFTYLRDTPARVETVLGDGRLSLEREPDQGFDVLVMDAFSGDSVPAHLLTLEAFRTYLRHLKPGGVLALNISNKYLNLRPVMARAASRFGKVAMCLEFSAGDEDLLCFGSSWALIMDAGTREALAAKLASSYLLPPDPGFRPWTDDYSNILRILK